MELLLPVNLNHNKLQTNVNATTRGSWLVCKVKINTAKAILKHQFILVGG